LRRDAEEAKVELERRATQISKMEQESKLNLSIVEKMREVESQAAHYVRSCECARACVCDSLLSRTMRFFCVLGDFAKMSLHAHDVSSNVSFNLRMC
jgi:hypothetical protein